jgi:FlaG/FlaF family flagellin (archaellin)
LIAITVILAAVIGAVVLGLGTGGVDTPQAQLQGQFTDTSGDGNIDTVEIAHKSGEPLSKDEIKFVNGTNAEVPDGNVTIAGDALTAGETATVADGTGEITLIWEDPNSDSETILEEFSE